MKTQFIRTMLVFINASFVALTARAQGGYEKNDALHRLSNGLVLGTIIFIVLMGLLALFRFFKHLRNDPDSEQFISKSWTGEQPDELPAAGINRLGFYRNDRSLENR